MKWWAVLLISLGTLLLGLAIGGAVGGVAGYGTGYAKGLVDGASSQPPVPMPSTAVTLTVDAPASVNVGETFNVTCIATNPPNGPVESLGDLDFDWTYLSGFELVSITPTLQHETQADEWQTFYTNAVVQPGAAQTFVLKLKAKTAGTYMGDVSLYVGDFDDLLSQSVQTVVVP
jgi:hypothetical protein